jgi:outer membrane protein TolC
VYRWESEIAQQRNELIQTNALRNLAEIELNRVLVRPLEEPFVTESLSLTGGDFLVDGGWLQQNVGDPVSFRRLRMWLVEEALRNSPELQALDAAIAAQDRSLAAANRAYYVPDVFLSGGYDWILDRSGAGAEGLPTDPDGPPDIFPAAPDDHDWNIVLALSLPLFEGGARRADQLQARRDLELLYRQREATAQRVAQRVRSAAHAAGASFANIRNSRDAANAAARSLEVMKDAYARGAANFLDLLEAQNNALVTDVVATNALYSFLIDYMTTQRAVGRFDLLLDDEQRQEVKDRRDAFMTGVDEGSPD